MPNKKDEKKLTDAKTLVQEMKKGNKRVQDFLKGVDSRLAEIDLNYVKSSAKANANLLRGVKKLLKDQE